ncbi:MAG TPA: hypothetical protein VI636_09345 [Candidatus Angelobacter sp.]
MPRTLAAGMQQWMRNEGSIAPIVLADIQTADGTQFFWADVEGSYISLLTGTSQFYSGWVKHAAPFVCTKDLSTSAGDLFVQNLSGNSIDMDVSLAVGVHEFEGALCVVRIWLPLFDAAMISFQGSLSETTPTEDECSFRFLQLFDTAQFDVNADLISEICPWRFKGVQCGSTGTATICDKLFTTCQASDHAAQERFAGVLYVVPNIGVSSPSIGPGGGGVPRPTPGPGGFPRPGIGPGGLQN